MSREKQIEEMTKDLCDIECKGMKCNDCDYYGCEYRMQAEALYNEGYRKQSEGEWLIKKHPLVGDYDITCSLCEHKERRGPAWSESWGISNFCPNCGASMSVAKMKGGAE